MITDEEILDDWVFYEEFIENHSTDQCANCGGFALFCDCTSNCMHTDIKDEVKRYIELCDLKTLI